MRLALVMHNPLAVSFKDCATHILGNVPELECFDILPMASPEQEIIKIQNWIQADTKDQTVIIICDIYGATPFNIASKACDLARSEGYNINIFAGANVCMLLKALTESSDDTDLFIQKIYEGAQRGIIKIDTP